MLQTLMCSSDACQIEVLGTDVLVSELVERIGGSRPPAVCIGSLAPGGLSRATHVCKRLRAHFPGLRIVVGRWAGSPDQAERLGAAGADRVPTTLLETRIELLSLVSLAPSDPYTSVASRLSQKSAG
jgi:hypothetical protein